MEIGLVQGWIKEILGLEKEQVDDVREELDELCSLSVTLGDERGAFYRRAREHVRASVAEVYSPPRVTKAATALPRLGIEAGAALDITTCDEHGTPWDFSKEEMRRKAEQLIDFSKPYLLVGSPMCTKFSSWQQINRMRSKDMSRFHLERDEAVRKPSCLRMPLVRQTGRGRTVVLA